MDLELSSGLLDQRAPGDPFEDSRSPRRRFGYCLVTWASRPPPAVVRNPLRSDLTLFSCGSYRSLNVRIGNSTLLVSVECITGWRRVSTTWRPCFATVQHISTAT